VGKYLGSPGRLLDVQAICAHEGFHEIRTSYDPHRGLLVFDWTCERCGALLSEARRQNYRPVFDPSGSQPVAGHSVLPGNGRGYDRTR